MFSNTVFMHTGVHHAEIQQENGVNDFYSFLNDSADGPVSFCRLI